MKRIITMLSLLALLLGLWGCSSQTAESAAVSDPQPSYGDVVQATEVNGYFIPDTWTENSINNGTIGYVTADAGLPNGTLNGNYIDQQSHQEDGSIHFVRYDLRGTELCNITIAPKEVPEGTEQYFSFYRFGEDSLWLVRYCYRVLDEEAGEIESSYHLEQWSYSGEMCLSIDLADFGFDDINDFLTGMELGTGGTPILQGGNTYVFLDENGQQIGTMDTGGIWYDLRRDAAGRLYVVDGMEIYTLDETRFCLGEKVMDFDGSSRVLPGGGEYDLFFSNATTLKGVNFQTGTVTEILSWADWDLADSVGRVTVLENGDFLVSANSLLGDDTLLTMTPVPAEEIPEKTVLRVAVPLSQQWAEMGSTWIDSMDQRIAEAMNIFNRSNPAYRIEAVTYSSATELNLMLMSGDSPDLIYWNYTAWLDEPASTAILSKKGYLEDLEPWFESDETLSLSNYIPNVVELERQRNGGIYALPLSFYFTALVGQKDYVGEDTLWTLQDALAAAEQLPEDMCFWEYNSPQELLKILLEANLTRFVDEKTAECDFRNEDFYTLLELCRDYGEVDADTEDYTPPAGGGLVSGFSSEGRLGMVYLDTVAGLEAQGKVIKGYPGAEGNGLSLIFNDQLAICSMSQRKEAAWSFLRTLFEYDFQDSYSSIFISIREDVFNDREDSYQELNSENLTVEQSQYMRDLVYAAKSIRNLETPVLGIVSEEAGAYFAGDKTAEDVAAIIENRVKIYLSEQY